MNLFKKSSANSAVPSASSVKSKRSSGWRFVRYAAIGSGGFVLGAGVGVVGVLYLLGKGWSLL